MEIELIRGDLTKINCGVLVNAANSSLLGGGGVDGAIHRAGGPEILKECKQIRKEHGKLATGKAVITNAGNLPANYVIHTVGPIWEKDAPEQSELLADCYRNSLKLAEEYQQKSIAFPNISTGVYGYPKEEAAEIAIETVKRFNFKSIQKVFFVCFDEENFRIYQEILGE